MSYEPEELFRRYDRLKADRGTWESHWEELAEFISPRKMGFTGLRSPGEKRMTRVFDPIGIRANELLAAGLHGMATNPASKWFTIRMSDDELNEDEEVKVWKAEVERRMFSAMHAPGTAITTHLHELYLDLGSFGTSVMFIGMTGDNRLLFQARALSECVIDDNAEGLVDTLFRKFKQTVRQCVQTWGDAVSPKIKEKFGQGKLDDPVEILHAVHPRMGRKPGRRDKKNLPFASCYYECDGYHLLSESGFEEFPYAVPRWYRQAGEIYGRSPGMTALPDVKMVQEMMKTTIKAAQKVVDPPLQVPDDGIIGPVRTVPGGLNFYRGQREIVALNTKGRIDLGLDLMNQTRQSILSTFFVDVLQIPMDAKMTATEVMQRTQERMRLLGPVLGRMEAELLGPLITRVFGLMSRVPGLLPLPPEAIENREWTVEYVSPLARAQKQQEADGLVQVLNILLPLAQAKPEVMERLKSDQLLPWLGDRYGVDPDLILSDDDLEAQQQQQQLMAAIPAAQGAAAAGKDVGAAVKAFADAGALDPSLLPGQPQGRPQ